MKPIRVIQWGFGAMGSGMARLVLQKHPHLQLVGVIDTRPELLHRDVGEILGLSPIGVTVQNNPASVLATTGADICIQAIHSFTKECFPHMECVLDHKLNLITIAEEMAYPEAQNPELAQKLHEKACSHGVTVLGTGINPGFILDAQIVMLSAACLKVERIEASRVNDLSPFGPTVMKTQGVGSTPEQFAQGIADGSIVGHIGFPESIQMIASALGLKIDKIEEIRRPILSKVLRVTPHVTVQPGMVAGCEHIGIGYCQKHEIIKLIHPQQIHPQLENIPTGDTIHIFGDPTIKMCNAPEIPGGKGTIAMAINSIPGVVRASPGLKRMVDLPIPGCLMGESAYQRRA